MVTFVNPPYNCLHSQVKHYKNKPNAIIAIVTANHKFNPMDRPTLLLRPKMDQFPHNALNYSSLD